MAEASDHVQVQHENRPLQGPCRVLAVVFRPEQAQFLTGEGDEDQRTWRSSHGGERTGEGQHDSGAGCVVVGPMVDGIAPVEGQPWLPPSSQVIIVGADHDGLVLQTGIAPRQNGDDVGGLGWRCGPRPAGDGEDLQEASAVSTRGEASLPEHAADESGCPVTTWGA